MKHLITIAAALLGSVTLAPAIANAQATSYYTATAMAAPAASKLITQSAVWSCAGTTCVAAKAPVRDQILCQMVAKNVGQLSSFTVAGAAYDAATLAKCNAHAK